MAQYVYKLPDIGEGIAEAEIVKWHAAAGQRIAQDQPLVDVMTDKATVEIAAPVTGVLSQCNGREGQKMAVGAVLAVFDMGEAEGPVPTGDVAVATPAAPRAPSSSGARAAPAIRARARKLGIDLASTVGSGPGGRILHDDLDRVLLSRARPQEPAPASTAKAIEEIQVFGLRRRIAERMQESKRRIPHFTYVEEVDVEAVERERERLNAGGTGEHITLLPFFIRALVRAVKRQPEVNGHFDDAEGKIRRFHAVHVGIATQTERGLLVPVIRDAQDRDLVELAAEIHRLSSAARAGKSSSGDLAGSTITITSLGALGGIMATPIINPPELAVVGINSIRQKLVLQDGQIASRRVVNLSSSFDHRIIDGFIAASFIAALREDLEAGLDASARPSA